LSARFDDNIALAGNRVDAAHLLFPRPEQ
jgi:hypothetical protein